MRQSDAQRQIHADRMRLVVLRQAVHVTLRLHVEFLRTQLVFEADAVVVVAAAGDRLALEAAFRRFRRQVPRRRRHGVVQAAEDQWSIRVAVHETDDHFLPDPRNVDAAEVHARPRLAHTHPARIRRIVARIPVPQEAHLDAAELVGPHLVSRRADDDRRLRAARGRLRRLARHPEHFARRLHDQLVAALVAIAAAGFVRDFGQHQRRFDDQVLAIRFLVLMVRQRERLAARETAHVALAECARAGRTTLLHPDAADQVAMLAVGIVARPFEQFALAPVRIARLMIRRHEQRPRAREIEIVDDHAARPQRLVCREVVEILDVDLAAFRMMANFVIGGTRRAAMRADVIAQHETVLPSGMLEEPVNPPFLHQALDEIEIRLAVLDLERPRFVARALALHRVFVDVEPLVDRIRIIAQHGVDDLDHRLVLKNLVVARQRGEPEPRPQYDPIDVVAPFGTQETRFHDEAADFASAGADTAFGARADALELHADGHLRPDHCLQIEVRTRRQRHVKIVRRAQQQLVCVQPPEVFFAAQRQEPQRGPAEQPRHRVAANRYRALLNDRSFRRVD
ncbi:hypothetical protein AK34_3165 [Burkholderia dolosa AU0158]|nr:hypothetical protein AK34_3165 [Burkholderia dolosa AU0158]